MFLAKSTDGHILKMTEGDLEKMKKSKSIP